MESKRLGVAQQEAAAMGRSLLSGLAIVWLAVTGGGAAFADIAPDPLSGGKNLAVKGRVSTEVAMVDEVLQLRLSREACHVDVVFTMKNTGAKAESIEVGFPGPYEGEFKEFKATVDGRPIEVKNAQETAEIDPDYPQRYRRKTYWKTWEMTFPPDRPVKITVSYSTKLTVAAGWSVAGHSIRRLDGLAEPNEREVLRKQLIRGEVEYSLMTGSHWSGPIGHCRIEVTFDGMTSDNLTLDSPGIPGAHAETTRDKIVWDLKDYEPKTNVYLTITPEMTRQATLELIERFHKRHPFDPDLTEMRAEHLVAVARRPEADKLVLDLLKHWENEIVIWGPGSEQRGAIQRSADVFSLIRKRTSSYADPATLDNAAEFAPVIERIANRVKGQLEFAPPDRAAAAKHYSERIAEMLEWCRKHGKSK